MGVWSTDRDLAANTANTIAVEYRNRRLDDLKAQSERALSQFTDEVAKQRTIVEKLYLEAAEIRRANNIVDPDPEARELDGR